MPLTDAQKRAQRKWQKNNTTMITMRLQNGADEDILRYLEGKKKQTVFKMAIREYMENHKDEGGC